MQQTQSQVPPSVLHTEAPTPGDISTLDDEVLSQVVGGGPGGGWLAVTAVAGPGGGWY